MKFFDKKEDRLTMKNDEEIIKYFGSDDLFGSNFFARLFREYIFKYGDERREVDKYKTESVDTMELIYLLQDFYSDKKGYDEILDRLIKNNDINRVNDNSMEQLLLLGRNKYDVSYSPINIESSLIQLAHEIETIREAEIVKDQTNTFNSKYFSYGPMNLVFPRARAKEMAIYLLNNGLFDDDNVIATMDTIFNKDIDSMEKYLKSLDDNYSYKKTDPLYSKNVVDGITSLPFALGEVISSTVVEKCSDYYIYDDVQKTILSRGPGFSLKMLEDLGTSREELVENGDKVLRKIRDTK